MAKVFLDTVKLYYEESKAAREQAEGLLEKYRTNTSTLLALALGSGCFLWVFYRTPAARVLLDFDWLLCGGSRHFVPDLQADTHET